MRATDLMVGDWVMLTDPIHNGEKVQVREIHADGHITVDGGIMPMFEPIPLTAEILAKNGFEIQRHRDLGGDVFGSLNTYWLGGEIGTFRLQKYELDDEFQFGLAKIKYVHELQHALRLCGIKKEITI